MPITNPKEQALLACGRQTLFITLEKQVYRDSVDSNQRKKILKSIYAKSLRQICRDHDADSLKGSQDFANLYAQIAEAALEHLVERDNEVEYGSIATLYHTAAQRYRAYINAKFKAQASVLTKNPQTANMADLNMTDGAMDIDSSNHAQVPNAGEAVNYPAPYEEDFHIDYPASYDDELHVAWEDGRYQGLNEGYAAGYEAAKAEAATAQARVSGHNQAPVQARRTQNRRAARVQPQNTASMTSDENAASSSDDETMDDDDDDDAVTSLDGATDNEDAVMEDDNGVPAPSNKKQTKGDRMVCTVAGCNKEITKAALKQHNAQYHDPTTVRYPCFIGDCEFKSVKGRPDDLKDHMDKVHFYRMDWGNVAEASLQHAQDGTNVPQGSKAPGQGKLPTGVAHIKRSPVPILTQHADRNRKVLIVYRKRINHLRKRMAELVPNHQHKGVLEEAVGLINIDDDTKPMKLKKDEWAELVSKQRQALQLGWMDDYDELVAMIHSMEDKHGVDHTKCAAWKDLD